MAEEKKPTTPPGPSGGGGAGGAGGGGEKPKTLEMRVAEIEDKLNQLTGGATAAQCGYCWGGCSYPPGCIAAVKPCIAAESGAQAQAAPPCVAAQAAPPCIAAQAAPPCVAAQAAPPCVAAQAGCIMDCYIYRCIRCIIQRCIIPIFDCINECGPGLPGGPVTGGFGGFGR